MFLAKGFPFIVRLGKAPKHNKKGGANFLPAKGFHLFGWKPFPALRPLGRGSKSSVAQIIFKHLGEIIFLFL